MSYSSIGKEEGTVVVTTTNNNNNANLNLELESVPLEELLRELERRRYMPGTPNAFGHPTYLSFYNISNTPYGPLGNLINNESSVGVVPCVSVSSNGVSVFNPLPNLTPTIAVCASGNLEFSAEGSKIRDPVSKDASHEFSGSSGVVYPKSHDVSSETGVELSVTRLLSINRTGYAVETPISGDNLVVGAIQTSVEELRTQRGQEMNGTIVREYAPPIASLRQRRAPASEPYKDGELEQLKASP